MSTQQPLPAAIDKRNMLWAPDPRKPFDPLLVGEAFLEQGRHSEALDFFERVTDEATRLDRVARIKKEAIAAGNAFLLSRLVAKNLATITKDDWSQCARAARASGQLRYALRAAIQAGDEGVATELRAQLGDAVPQALAARAAVAAVAESPEQAQAGATHPGQKVEAVAATGAAHQHEPQATPPPAAPPAPTNGTDSAKV